MTKESITVSAPGRICLFGEHQDYFQLPVIAAAIDLRIFISGSSRSDKQMVIDLPDIREKEAFFLQEKIPYTQKRDYLRSAVNVLQRQHIALPHGWECWVRGDIPINSGAASSSALVVAWMKFLLEASQSDLSPTETEIAELSYLAEVDEFNEPGGKMDHYTSAYGGIISLEFGAEQTITKLQNTLDEFVLADSLERKQTTSTLAFIKEHVLDGVARIQKKIPDFDLIKPVGERENKEIEALPSTMKRVLKGTVMTRDITRKGLEFFRRGKKDQMHLGRLLNHQQHILRDYLHVSTQKIDKMIAEALNAGAMGAKINGSGEGGSIFAYAPSNSEKVAEALEKLDTKVFIIKIGEGVRLENMTEAR